MNIKKGFTLAEVLVTIGVIGVITALAVPIVHQSGQKAQVGPVLKKFMSTMETVNEQALLDADQRLLSSAYRSVTEYQNDMSKYIQGKFVTKDVTINYYRGGNKATYNNKNAYRMKDDREFFIIGPSFETSINPASGSSYKGAWAQVYLDINGFSNKPNRLGKDIFVFVIDNNGSVLPFGGSATQDIYGVPKKSCTDVNTGNGDYSEYCAGMIADNNWKVTYKY